MKLFLICTQIERDVYTGMQRKVFTSRGETDKHLRKLKRKNSRTPAHKIHLFQVVTPDYMSSKKWLELVENEDPMSMMEVQLIERWSRNEPT